MLDIYVDADGCPVKQEIYRVAQRYGLQVILVANAGLSAPKTDWLRCVLVDGGMDAADDWIAENAGPDDIVITADIPLASRCLETGSRVLDPRGRTFTDAKIGDMLASRDLNAHLRQIGAIASGPRPMDKKERSRFLSTLDETIVAIRRRKPTK